MKKGRRRAPRIRRRLTCELHFDGRKASGIVLNISQTGMFVQTAVKPAPGSVLDVQIAAHRSTPSLLVRARVARQLRVDPRLASIAPAGLGLEVLDAPPEYYRLSEDAEA